MFNQVVVVGSCDHVIDWMQTSCKKQSLSLLIRGSPVCSNLFCHSNFDSRIATQITLDLVGLEKSKRDSGGFGL